MDGWRLKIERDDDPNWMSLALRMKLDLAGVKVSLGDWQMLGASTRSHLQEMNSSTQSELEQFAAELGRALEEVGAHAPKALSAQKLAKIEGWKNPGPIPEAVSAFCEAAGLKPRWEHWGRFQRFVVCHLAAREDAARLSEALAEFQHE